MASCESTYPPLLEVAPTKHPPNATVIFLHGAGDTGSGVSSWIDRRTSIHNNGFDFKFPNIKILYPTAPLRYYTPCREQCHIWLNWPRIEKPIPEDLHSIDEGAQQICELVKQEIRSGTPLERIIIGGLSMGGMMAIHVAFRHFPNVAGVFALSTYLNNNSKVFEVLSSGGVFPKLYMAHGTHDHVIPCKWGQETFASLHAAGVQASFKSYPNLPHDMCLPELRDLHSWITNTLPDI